MSTENIDLEVNRIKQNISDSYSELSMLGATIPAIKSADNLANCINTLQTSHIITQNGDNLVTNYGANINHDGKNTIENLALSQRPAYSDFLVADDGNSTVKFSLDDLKTWINKPVPTTKQRLVSVADNLDTNKLVLYTDDGINWNTSTMPNSRNWGNVFYGNGKFIVPCYNSNKFAYSADGINWTEGTFDSSGYWKKGVYGNGIYACISSYQGDMKIATSTDGINWTTSGRFPSEVNSSLGDVIWDGNKFVLIFRGSTGAEDDFPIECYTTQDFKTFSTMVVANNLLKIPYAIQGVLTFDGNFYNFIWTDSITGNTYAQYIHSSSDLINWTQTFTDNYNNVSPITSCHINNSTKVFSGRTYFSQQSAGYINIDSNNTPSFIGSSVPRLNYQGGANVINDRAVVIGYGSDQYIYSTDGTTWNTGTLPASSGWWGSCVGEVTV